VCPMGYAELRARLGWTRNTLRGLLAELETYGLIDALEDFRPFENRRPQVYRVHLPREFVAAKWRELEEQERRKAGEEGIARLKALLDRDPETKRAIEDLGVTAEGSSRSHSA
jgi:DNA-binding FadR family transcriptional regulator